MKSFVGSVCAVLTLICLSCGPSLPFGLERGSELAQIAEASGLLADVAANGIDERAGCVVGEVRFRIQDRPQPRLASYFKMGVASIGKDGGEFENVFPNSIEVSDAKTAVVDGYSYIEVMDGRESVDRSRKPLVFREFQHGVYYIKDVSSGKFQIWFRIAFDGIKVTQIPIDVEIDVSPAGVTRLDLDVDLAELFIDL